MVLTAIIATSLIGLVNPYLLKVLTDEVIIGHNFDRLNLYVGLMIAMPILSGLIGVGQSYLNNLIGQSVMQDLRNALYAHLQRMPLRFFTSTRTGEIQSRMANDVGGVQSLFTDTAATILSNVVIVVSTVIASNLVAALPRPRMAASRVLRSVPCTVIKAAPSRAAFAVARSTVLGMSSSLARMTAVSRP